MAVAVSGCCGVFRSASAPCHDTPPTASRRYSPATPTQLRPRLTRHLHNLKPRRRTLRAVDARPTSLTLNIERLPTYLATSLRLHSLSLSIVAPVVVLGGDDCWGAGPEDAPRRKTDLLCRAFLLNHQRRELSNAGDDRKTCVRRWAWTWCPGCHP
jgi:hypothetical protein